MRIALCIAAAICAGLHALAAMQQIRGGRARSNALLMILANPVVLIGIILCLLNRQADWLFVALGLGMIAVAAIRNGRSKQQVHIRHHAVRVLVFMALSIGFIIL